MTTLNSKPCVAARKMPGYLGQTNETVSHALCDEESMLFLLLNLLCRLHLGTSLCVLKGTGISMVTTQSVIWLSTTHLLGGAAACLDGQICAGEGGVLKQNARLFSLR